MAVVAGAELCKGSDVLQGEIAFLVIAGRTYEPPVSYITPPRTNSQTPHATQRCAWYVHGEKSVQRWGQLHMQPLMHAVAA